MLCVQDPGREENQILQQQLKEKDELIVRLQAELVRKLDEFNVTFHNRKFHNHLQTYDCKNRFLCFVVIGIMTCIYLTVRVNILLVSCPFPLPRLTLGSYGDAARQFPLNWGDI